MPLLPKRGIAKLGICAHGGINHAELKVLGINPNEVLDFSVCTNPFMPPPGIKEMLSAIPIEQYPDSEATELRLALSKHLGVPVENIIAGSGTTELIRLIAITYFRQGETAIVLEPTYGDYEIACRLADMKLVRYRAREEDNFTPEIPDFNNLISKFRPRAAFVCNPNNPTGKYLSRFEVEFVLDAVGDGLLILDEAYIAFVDRRWDSIDLVTRGNVVILRSMTKEYGLPGLRLGYAIARRETIDNLRCVCPPWNVNIIAQKVGTEVLEKNEYLEQSLKRVKEAKIFLMDGLSRLGYRVLPSDTHYFLVKVGDARNFRDNLLKRGMLVRDCTSLGLPEYVRIAPRSLAECEKLISAIGRMLDNR